MRGFWEEVRAVFRAGWAVLGGALVTAVLVVLSAFRLHLSWTFWWIPFLAGLVVAEGLVIAKRRGERDEARAEITRLTAVPELDFSLKTEEGQPQTFRLRITNSGPMALSAGSLVNVLVPRGWELVALNGKFERLSQQWGHIQNGDEPILLRSADGEVPGSVWHHELPAMSKGQSQMFWFYVANYTEEARITCVVVPHKRESWWLKLSS